MDDKDKAKSPPHIPTKEEMLAAGIPEKLHPMVPLFDSLKEAKQALVS